MVSQEAKWKSQAVAIERKRKRTQNVRTARNCLYTLALTLVPISIVFGLLAITVLIIYFLVVDDGRGGACAQTSGRAIWIYSIFRLVVNCFSAQVYRTEVDKQETQNACPQFLTTCCGNSIALTVWIYGGIVIYAADVCDQFKNTGLYKIASAAYIIDVILGSLGMMYQFYQLLVPDTDLRPAWLGGPSKKSLYQKDVVERPLDMEKADGDKDKENRQKELGSLQAEVERRKAAKAEADRKMEVVARIEAEIDAEEMGVVADVVPPPNKI